MVAVKDKIWTVVVNRLQVSVAKKVQSGWRLETSPGRKGKRGVRPTVMFGVGVNRQRRIRCDRQD